MELRDFVTNTLVEILDGVVAAQAKYPPLNDPNNVPKHGSINPRWFNREPVKVGFDVSVEATSAEGGRGGIRVAAFGVEVGSGDKAATRETTSANRIRFEVMFPFEPRST